VTKIKKCKKRFLHLWFWCVVSVDASEAGAGNLEVAVRSAKTGVRIPHFLEADDRSTGLFQILFTPPPDCFRYEIDVSFNDWPVNGDSPTHTHTHPFNGPFPGLPGWAGTRKVKPIWILLKQETVSGTGISMAICKSAPRSRQITTPAPPPLTEWWFGQIQFSSVQYDIKGQFMYALPLVKHKKRFFPARRNNANRWNTLSYYLSHSSNPWRGKCH